MACDVSPMALFSFEDTLCIAYHDLFLFMPHDDSHFSIRIKWKWLCNIQQAFAGVAQSGKVTANEFNRIAAGYPEFQFNSI